MEGESEDEDESRDVGEQELHADAGSGGDELPAADEVVPQLSIEELKVRVLSIKRFTEYITLQKYAFEEANIGKKRSCATIYVCAVGVCIFRPGRKMHLAP
jgi:hypothetical protein